MAGHAWTTVVWGGLALSLLACQTTERSSQRSVPTEGGGPHWSDCFAGGESSAAYEYNLASSFGVGEGEPSAQAIAGIAQLASRRSEGTHQLRLDFGTGDAGESNSTLGAALRSSPCVLEYSGGFLKGLRQGPNQSPESVGLCRSIGAALQDAYSASGGAGAWSARAWDSTGEYEASFSLGEHNRLEVRKTRYLSLVANVRGSGLGRVPTQTLPTITNSHATLECDGGQLSAASLDEELELPLGVRSKAVARTRLTLKRQERPVAIAPPDWSDVDDNWVSVSIQTPVRQRSPGEESFDELRRQGWTYEKALQAVGETGEALAILPSGSEGAEQRKELGAPMAKAFQALAAFLREDFRRVDEVATRVRRKARGANALTGVLGACGSSRAQAALVSLVEEQSLGVAERGRAVRSLLQVNQPTASLVDGLERCWLDPKLGRSCAQVLGAMGRHARENGDSTLAERVRGTIVGRLARPGEVELALDALANLGAAGTAGLVSPLLSSPSEAVRGKALIALRLAPDPERESILLAGLGDRSAQVRDAALQALGQQPGTRTALDRVKAVADSDPSASVRKHAGKVMATWLDFGSSGTGPH